jgi:hypothetical protein
LKLRKWYAQTSFDDCLNLVVVWKNILVQLDAAGDESVVQTRGHLRAVGIDSDSAMVALESALQMLAAREAVVQTLRLDLAEARAEIAQLKARLEQ